MDKKFNQVTYMLFEIFGLCPDYAIQQTKEEWVEIYPMVDSNVSETFRPEFKQKRYHLIEHRALLDSGLWVIAYFAVDHTRKVIFLKVTSVAGGDALWVEQYNG